MKNSSNDENFTLINSIQSVELLPGSILNGGKLRER